MVNMEFGKNIEKLIQFSGQKNYSLAKELGYVGKSLIDTLVSPRGYRISNKVPRIPSNVIENLVGHFGKLKYILEAGNEELDQVEGIGEARARAIKNGLRRIREQVALNKNL